MAFNSLRKERPDPADLDLNDGTVTRLAQQKKDLDRVSVFLDESFAFGLAVDLVIEAGLHKGQRLTAAEQRALLVRQESFAAKASALAGLASQARTTKEVRDALARKGFAEPIIEDTVADLERLGVVDDAAYARAFARGRFSGRGYGPARLRQDLIKKGVAREAIDAALAELTEAEDLGGAAREQAQKKWRALSSEDDLRKRKKKTLDYLMRRGFGFDSARSAVDAAAEQDEAEGETWD